jgi:hypothetical protein
LLSKSNLQVFPLKERVYFDSFPKYTSLTSCLPRSGLQNGFWGVKYLLIIGGWVGAFFIPHGNFGPTWMYFGLVGGLLFILIQLVLIIDLAHSWAEAWQAEHRSSGVGAFFFA